MKKITEETKLKELIPEGYELEEKELNIDKDINGTGLITFSIKKKQEKDFQWYVMKHIESFGDKVISTDIQYRITREYEEKMYNNIPREFKIGLLWFICDDLKFDNLTFLTILKDIELNLFKNEYKLKICKGTEKILDICPKEFLNSII